MSLFNAIPVILLNAMCSIATKFVSPSSLEILGTKHIGVTTSSFEVT